MSSRRRFLAFGTAACVAALRPLRLFAQRRGIPVFSQAATGAYQQGLLTRSNFTKLVGHSFRIFLDDDKVAEVQLQSVLTQEDVARTARGGGPTAKADVAKLLKQWPSPDDCFMLRFTTGNTLVPQDSFILDHATLGSFVVFLVPLSTTPGSATSIATFNYATKASPQRIPLTVRQPTSLSQSI